MDIFNVLTSNVDHKSLKAFQEAVEGGGVRAMYGDPKILTEVKRVARCPVLLHLPRESTRILLPALSLQ
jgi:hypothetical protein